MLPLYLTSIFGKDQTSAGYWLIGLRDQFLIVGLPLTALLFVFELHPQPKASVVSLVLVVLIASLLVIGQRLTIVVSVVMFLSVLARYRWPVVRTQIKLALVLVPVAAVMISATRFNVGRITFTAGSPADRFNAILDSVSQLLEPRDNASSDISNGILNDFVYRFDGNAFPAMIHVKLEGGWPTAGLNSILNDIFLAVPSFINPNKLDTDPTIRNEKYYMTVWYDLYGTGNPLLIDYLPMTLGMLYSYYGTIGLLVSVLGLGVGFAWIDTWMRKGLNTSTLLVGLGLTYCVIFMEQGVAIYFLTFRGIAVAGLVLFFLQRIINITTIRSLRVRIRTGVKAIK